MKKIFFIHNKGNLKRKDNTFMFEPAENLPDEWDENLNENILLSAFKNKTVRYDKDKYIPINDVDSICVLADITFNKRLLEFIGTHHIPMHIFNWYGNYKGSFLPPADVLSGSFMLKQARFYFVKKRRLELAKRFVTGACGNIYRNVRRYARDNIELDIISEKIKELSGDIDKQVTQSALLSLEARIHKVYFSAFNLITVSDIKFRKREYNPPTDPMNALISFANALVYSLVTSELYKTKLDPRISFLHEPGERRLSLVYDIAEVFKPLLADRLIFSLLNRNSIKKDKHFRYKDGACYLNNEGRRKVIEFFDTRINKTIRHRDINKFISYKSLIRLECYKIIEHINKNKDYKPFQIWW